MTIESFLKILVVAIALLICLVVLIQPSPKTGLIGDATDIEKREKRGAELFLYRATIILATLFIGFSIFFNMAQSGAI